MWNSSSEISTPNANPSAQFCLAIDAASTILAVFSEGNVLQNSTFSANTWTLGTSIAGDCIGEVSLGKSSNGKLITSWKNTQSEISASTSSF